LAILPVLLPIIFAAKIMSIPFKLFDIMLFILFPFRHPLIET
jgi:hypothetical protein